MKVLLYYENIRQIQCLELYLVAYEIQLDGIKETYLPKFLVADRFSKPPWNICFSTLIIVSLLNYAQETFN